MNFIQQITFDYLPYKWKRLVRTILGLPISGLILFISVQLLDNQYVDEEQWGALFLGVFGSATISYILYPFIIKNHVFAKNTKSVIIEKPSIEVSEEKVNHSTANDIETNDHNEVISKLKYKVEKNVVIAVGITFLIHTILIAIISGEPNIKFIGAFFRAFLVYSIVKYNIKKYKYFWPVFKLTSIIYLMQLGLGILFEFWEIMYFNL